MIAKNKHVYEQRINNVSLLKKAKCELADSVLAILDPNPRSVTF